MISSPGLYDLGLLLSIRVIALAELSDTSCSSLWQCYSICYFCGSQGIDRG